MLGTLLKDRYRVEAKLGEGGMGIIYRAHDTLLNRPVAIKSLVPALAGEEGIKRLLREAQAAAQLTHPNIVAVYDVIAEGDTRLIVMEYVEGRPLSDLIPLEVPRALDLAVQVCRALEYAHSQRVIHRDIKPENIMVTSGNVAKVADFGLARSEGRSRLTQSGLIVGTVAYMAPEQVLGGTVDGRSDLYSLGCVLYEVLTGRRPFEGEDPFTVLSQHLNVMPVAPRWHNGAIPATLDATIMRLLAKDPDNRYPLAAAVIEALELVGGESDTAVSVEREPPATRTTLLERIVRGRLVGRAAELQELREHLDRMLSGEGRLVLISGEPGIGKTRLAEELAVYAHLRGAWVLRGHCYEQEVGIPYLPFIETFRQLHHFSGPALANDLGERVDDLARLLPEFSRKQPTVSVLTPEDERIRVFDAVTHWISLASRLRPLVFVLDDLHWGDRASLRLLHHVARSARERVLMLGTYREMELDLEHPLNDTLSEMNRERLFYRLPLRRLSEEDTRTLLSGLFAEDVSQDLAGAVYRETEGNPFFIEEVVKALVEEGKIYREAGRWQRLKIEELEIPQSVKAVIGRRVHKASETCRRVLTIAAIIGREFDPEALVQVSQLEEDSVLDALDDAVRLQLIREMKIGRGAGYTFEHALIRQTLYESLNVRRRARLHQQVGEALEALYRTRLDDHIEELAYHFGEAGPATAAKGIEYNLRAARKAATLYAMEEAERRLMVGLELSEAAADPAARANVLKELGDLYFQFVENRRAVDAYQRALDVLKGQGIQQSADEVLRLYCKVAEASAGFGAAAAPEATVYAQTAVDTLRDRPDSPLKARALSLLAIHRARAGDLANARIHAEEAVALASRLEDQDELAMAYRAVAYVHRSSNEWDQFHEAVQKRFALRGGILAADVAFTPVDADLYADLILGYVSGGDLAGTEHAAREFLKLAEKLRSPSAVQLATILMVFSLFFSNQWEEARDFAGRVIDRAPVSGVGFAGRTLSFIGVMLVGRGEDERARAHIAGLEAASYALPPEHIGSRQAALATALMLADVELVKRLLPRVEAEKPRCLTCAFTFRLWTAHARLLLGDLAGAQMILDEAQSEASGQAPSLHIGDLAYHRGLVAEARSDLDGALRHLEDALLERARQEDVFRAIYREEAGRILLARGRPGDRERGRQLLGEAIATYRALGARRFEARARALFDSAASPQ